jgi:hypothetical protein
MMAPFIYRWPRTGLRVQGFGPLPGHLTDGEIYEPMTYTACRRIHLVNLKSGKVLESPEKQK